MTGSKSEWDITVNKVEGRPSKFGKSGAHICVPSSWLKKTVVVVTKDTWDALQQQQQQKQQVSGDDNK